MSNPNWGRFAVFFVGAGFAAGLGISGMTTADKVIGFLHPWAGWDPTLAVVLLSAVGAHLATWRLATSRTHPLFAAHYLIPTRTDLDLRLTAGAALFGLGWGLGGYCPGPGIVSAVSAAPAALVFVGGMLGGMALFHAAQTAIAEQRLPRAPLVDEAVVESSTGGNGQRSLS